MIVLFDLVTRSGSRPSPFCWRAKLSLLHKGLEFQTRAIQFSDIAAIGDGTFKTVPVMNDGETWVGGSRRIADALEARHAQRATLFPEDPQRHFAGFVEAWTDTTLHPQIFPLIAYDVWAQLPSSQQHYFRRTRERRLGTTLEAAKEEAMKRVSEIRAVLNPIRRLLEQRSFLAGAAPAYVDYLVFGALKWHSLCSPTPLYEAGCAIAVWFARIDESARLVK